MSDYIQLMDVLLYHTLRHVWSNRLSFTAVSDPEDPNDDCEELGSASLDLNMVSQYLVW